MPIIRAEQTEDRQAIWMVHTAAFPTDGEAQLVDALRAGGKATVSLVAEQDGAIVGHVLFSPVTGASGRPGVGLAPVAVLPAWQRRGIGSKLIEAGIVACRDAGIGFIVVLGHAGYYPRFGFRKASDFGLANEYDADEEFMVLELQPGALMGERGLVRYAAEFAALGSAEER
jgi:putative acetyltransferase